MKIYHNFYFIISCYFLNHKIYIHFKPIHEPYKSKKEPFLWKKIKFNKSI